MTLVQILADEKSVHMSCDFRLSNPYTNKVIHDEAHKLVMVTRYGWSAMVGVTGLGILGQTPTGTWIARKAAQLAPDSQFDDLLGVLSTAERVLAMVPEVYDRRHTFAIGAVVGSRTLVALVSNFETLMAGRVRRNSRASSNMTISSMRPQRPQLVVTGYTSAVTEPERIQLERAMRAGAGDDRLQKLLSQTNAAASKRSQAISRGCNTASLNTTGTGSSRPFLTPDQRGDFIPPDVAQLFDQLGLKLNRAVDSEGRPQPLRVVGTTSTRHDASPEYFRAQFKLRPDDAELWNNYGSWLVSRGKSDEAIKAFEKSLLLNEDYVIAMVNLAKTLWTHQGSVEEAENLYSRAVERSEPDVPSWILSDYAVFEAEGQRNFEKAEELHSRAASDIQFPVAKARQAWFVAEHQEDPQQGSRLIEEALVQAPRNSEVLLLGAQIDWIKLGQMDSARSKLETACAIDENNTDAMGLYATMLLINGDPQSALYYYRRAIKRLTKISHIHGNYGLALLMARKPYAAIKQLQRVAQSLPDDLNTKVNLAAAHYAASQQQSAVQLLHQVLELDPPPEIVLEIRGMQLIAEPQLSTSVLADIRALRDSGVIADGSTIRAMSRESKSRARREQGEAVAEVVEGKRPVSELDQVASALAEQAER